MWAKLEAAFGSPPDLNQLLAASDDELRAAGMSRQKSGYIRSLAELVISGELDLDNLPEDDEEAIALLTKIKGIGRWSAEIYLLFAEGRADVFPAGDLAVWSRSGGLWASPRSRARSSCANSPRPGVPTAAPPRCSPGTAIIRACSRSCTAAGRVRAPRLRNIARAEVEAQRTELLAPGLAADEISCRGLALRRRSTRRAR